MKLNYFPVANLTHYDYLEREQLGKRKINVTATLRNAPTTRAEVRVSSQTVNSTR